MRDMCTRRMILKAKVRLAYRGHVMVNTLHYFKLVYKNKYYIYRTNVDCNLLMGYIRSVNMHKIVKAHKYFGMAGRGLKIVHFCRMTHISL